MLLIKFLIISIVSITIPQSSSYPYGIGTCDSYDGVLRFQPGDSGAGAASAFFLYVVNQLIHADKYNLLPWIHFDYYGQVYDPDVHSISINSFMMLDGGVVSDDFIDGNRPYPAVPMLDSNKMIEKTFIVKGSGIWDQYFLPLNNFTFNDPSCKSKPYLFLSGSQLLPGIHYNAPWAVRAWQYGNMAQSNFQKRGQKLHDYMGDMRIRAAGYVQKHFKLQPWLQEKVDATNPMNPGDPPCLAIHIRWSDKAAGRKKVPLEAFLPYAEAYVKQGGKSIFIATDQTQVFDIINKDWPSSITSIIGKQQGTFLSKDNRAVFNQVSHHRSNTEAITEIYAMAKCNLLLHGFSAMAEAAIYLNIGLHDHSINMDDPEHPGVDVFQTMVKDVLKFRNVA